MAETTTAVVVIKYVDFSPRHFFDALNNKLCNAITA
jgi:hypothetical protein